jgi:hypothetical protein
VRGIFNIIQNAKDASTPVNNLSDAKKSFVLAMREDKNMS